MAQSEPQPPPSPPPGRLVDVGGWRLHLHCTGAVRPGQSTVVLESGIGAFSVEWALVQPRVAEFARVCSYDRAGSGWSEWGPHPRTFRQIVYELHMLLERAGERPPFLLVGASYGGWLVRVFQATYPTEVHGIILVDGGTNDPLRLTASGRTVRSSELVTNRAIPPVKTSGPLRESDIPAPALAQIKSGLAAASARANEPPRNKLPMAAQRMRTWGLGQIGHVIAAVNPFEAEELAELRALSSTGAHPLGDLPLLVITRGVGDAQGDSAQARENAHRRDHAALAATSRRGRHIIAAGSGHHVHIDDPALLVRAIVDLTGGGQSSNTLTDVERAAGWRLLFDGASLRGWRGLGYDSVPSAHWRVIDGAIAKIPTAKVQRQADGQPASGGDLMTIDAFRDFELVFEWRVTPGANSGVKYNVSEELSLAHAANHAALGFEYQVLDDVLHPDNKIATHLAGSLYDIIAPSAAKRLRRVGEWNSARIVLRENHGEHWLNGVKVVEFDLGTPRLDSLLEKSKYKPIPGFAERRRGHIILQDHGDEVYFRSIKIRELSGASR